jgi:hypothetical protein
MKRTLKQLSDMTKPDEVKEFEIGVTNIIPSQCKHLTTEELICDHLKAIKGPNFFTTTDNDEGSQSILDIEPSERISDSGFVKNKKIKKPKTKPSALLLNLVKRGWYGGMYD